MHQKVENLEPQKELLGHTAGNFPVHLNEKSSHAQTHLIQHPLLLDAVKKAIPTIEGDDDIIRIQVNAGEIIGTTDLVETSPDDEIVYAKRVARDIYSRFVKNKQPIPTSTITIDIRKETSSAPSYYLYTTFIGGVTPSFPGGEFLPQQSVEFWSTHALVWGTQEIIAGTETTVCPW